MLNGCEALNECSLLECFTLACTCNETRVHWQNVCETADRLTDRWSEDVLGGPVNHQSNGRQGLVSAPTFTSLSIVFLPTPLLVIAVLCSFVPVCVNEVVNIYKPVLAS